MSASAEAREILAPEGRLRVALDPDPTGVSKSLARELARQLRVQVVFDAQPVDVSFVRVTRERAKELHFSPPYFENYSIGITEDRSRALPFLRDFVDDAVQRGLVRDAVRRAGLRGTL